MIRKTLPMIYSIWIAITLVDLVTSAAVGDANVQGLYSSQDDVEILTASNFKMNVFGSDRSWLVEFYNTWCGFCQRFAPSWKQFATNVRNWKDIVIVAAVNCADEVNDSLCSEFDITRYPTVKYFRPQYEGGPSNIGKQVSPGSTAFDHRNALLKVMVSDQMNETKTMSPNLQQFSDDLSKIFDRNGEAPYAIFIVQDSSDTIGPQIILDLHSVKEVIVKYAYKNNSKVTSLLGSNTVPAVYVIERESLNSPKLLTSSADQIEVSLNHFLQSRNITVPEIPKETTKIKPASNITEPDTHQGMKHLEDAVYLADLESTLRYSLKREVGANRAITGEKLQALRAYLNVLEPYFPLGSKGKTFLKEIKMFVYESDVIDGIEISRKFKEIQNSSQQIFSSPQIWVGCKGSEPQYRGYPCGVWTMFHYLTVSSAEATPNPIQSGSDPVLQAMHGYIKNFFGCTDCSNHFQEMSARLGISKVPSGDDSILWLWKAHNEVNKRLTNDQTEDPEYPKIQFPAKERCADCYNSDGSWNEENVLKFLKRMYSSKNIKYVGSDAQVLRSNPAGGVSRGISAINVNIVVLGVSILLCLNYQKFLVY